jgi:hypothetical protein
MYNVQAQRGCAALSRSVRWSAVLGNGFESIAVPPAPTLRKFKLDFHIDYLGQSLCLPIK